MPANGPSVFDDVSIATKSIARGRGMVLADESLTHLPAFTTLLRTLDGQLSEYSVLAHKGIVGSLIDARELGSALRGLDFLVAFGGGTTMDRAKLGRLYSTGRDPQREVEDHSRGWWRLPAEGPRPITLLVVPTTLGTGSERNGNAIAQVGSDRSLLSGSVLIPTSTLLDVENYVSLPRRVVLDGIIEALSRVCEAYAFPGASVADELAVSVARELVRLGDKVARESEAVDRTSLRQIAKLSSTTHSQSLNRGRPPFAFRAWCISHELSAYANTSKVSALAAVLPKLHTLTDIESRSFGDPNRRRVILRAVGDARGENSSSFATFSRIISDWRVPIAPPPEDRIGLATKVIERWGGDDAGAHLHGVSAEEVASILGEST